ncbi:uncharacterized protein LOC117809948 [Notolabrus celidotus]|uniref:uncharacterized protein LOC117809948 n=1 Tax=Notolabrus celidotus TaxID=1203425 RepID=UPI00148FBE83|nr:uncharacterized protein LOC117809948 [Notolabrus celidotus]
MEVTSLCIRLLMGVLVLLVAQIDHGYFAQTADFPRVSPDRKQFFEYETVHISCEDFNEVSEWRVMQKLHKKHPQNNSDCSLPAPSCTIYPAFEAHSGGYWCEDLEGNTSRSINISVTAGPVILDVPATPVMEGHDLILQCRNKLSQSKHNAVFFKDGVHLETMCGDTITIKNVSKSDEGLYKCIIPGAGASPESWLGVLKKSNISSDQIQPPDRPSSDPPTLLWTAVEHWTVVSVPLVVTLLLGMGLFLCLKHKVSRGESDPDLDYALYSAVTYHKMDMVSGGEDAADPNNIILKLTVEEKTKAICMKLMEKDKHVFICV